MFFESADPALRASPAEVGAIDIEQTPQTYDVAYVARGQLETPSHTFELEIELADDASEVYLVVTGMSEAYFEYHRTLALQRRNDGDPLSEPVSIYTNIDNGVGVFGGYVNRVHALAMQPE